MTSLRALTQLDLRLLSLSVPPRNLGRTPFTAAVVESAAVARARRQMSPRQTDGSCRSEGQLQALPYRSEGRLRALYAKRRSLIWQLRVTLLDLASP